MMVEVVSYCGSLNAELLALLLPADPDAQAVAEYFAKGKAFVIENEGVVVAVAVAVLTGTRAELKNISVAEAFQGRGFAKLLIAAVVEAAKQAGAETIWVGTGNSSLDQLALYQKCGFRMDHVVVDFFADYSPAIYENDIRCIDMVMLKQPL